jgi:hypothetical protein
MSDFGTDKNTQFAEDKAKNKFDELAGSAQQQFGEFVDSPKHQVKVRLKNMPRRPAMPFPTSLKLSEIIPSPASSQRVRSVLFSACCWVENNKRPFGALFFLAKHSDHAV